jgi:hypothetical protein
MASFSFDTTTVAPRENNYELLPAGKYTCLVSDSTIQPLKSGNGTALKLTITVLQEGYNGRKLFANLNVQHTNPTAETIAQQQLRELCDAIGLTRMTDTAELHNKPFIARVKIRKSTDPQYEDQNEVAGYSPAGVSTAPAAPRAPAPSASAPAASASPPWAKKAA